MKRSFQLKLLLLSTVYCLLSTLSGCCPQPLYKDSQLLMGTVIEVTSPDKRAPELVFERIREIEKLFSKFDKHSQIYRLNKFRRLVAGPEVIELITRAKYFYRVSEGAFDISVGPLVDLWKGAIETGELPTPRQIDKARNLLGMDDIIIDPKKSLIRFKRRGLSIDLGGIAKGYAVDAAIQKLRQEGIVSALVNAGGDMYCLGVNQGRAWKVGIQHPRQPGQIKNYLRLVNKAVATSGDYEQYIIVNKQRFSHIIDPRTGYPADKGIVSVTVIAQDCLSADALATSIFILGKDKGLELLNKFKGVEVRIITVDNV